MLTAEMIATLMVDLVKDHTAKMEKMTKRIAAIQKVEAAGLTLVKNRWDVPYAFHIKREDLPALRKIVGRVQVTNTDVPYDYETCKEIDVTIKPMADEFSDLRFNYRKPYNGQGKCKVVESTQTYRSLVCTK